MTHRQLVLALALSTAPLAGCGDAPSPSTGGGSTGGASNGAHGGATSTHGASLPVCPPDDGVEAPHEDISGGVYSVPVPPELEPYASYPVDDITLCWTGSAVQLGYSLPALLVGKKQRVSFTGSYDEPSGDFVLASDDGTATCTPADVWSCAEIFTGIEVDLEEVAEEVEDLDPVEAQARLEVAKRFEVDPIGLLDFPSP
jgi:hypothetical protein